MGKRAVNRRTSEADVIGGEDVLSAANISADGPTWAATAKNS
jgi:hypothetical protein